MRVLVVEDHPKLAIAVATGLRRAGMAVDMAFDGHDALAHADGTDYDVVVLDRDIPGVHGDQVCRSLVADGSDARVLMLTAAGAVSDRVEGLGARLVVVVDGLDEDDAGAVPLVGERSIASLLPRRSPPGARFIITGRPDPGLPSDLKPGHPLLSCATYQLRASRIAEDIGKRTTNELLNLLNDLDSDQLAIDTIGYIAAAQGGLTISDLSELTKAPRDKLERRLRGKSGRSLRTRVPADSRANAADPAARVYLFAHETLLASAKEQLGREQLARYRQKVHEWIDSFAHDGWPRTTPGYAIRGYPSLLAATRNAKQLTSLASDPRRHTFLLQATGSDYAALAEIRTAVSLILDQPPLNMRALLILTAYRHLITNRNWNTPVKLPVVWAKLAHFDRAEALARTISDVYLQALALTGLVAAAVQAGEPDRARRLAAETAAVARTITSLYNQTYVFTTLISTAVQAGDRDQVRQLAEETETLARSITDDLYLQALALTRLVATAVQAGEPDRARRLAEEAEPLPAPSPIPTAMITPTTSVSRPMCSPSWLPPSRKRATWTTLSPWLAPSSTSKPAPTYLPSWPLQ